MEKEHVDAAIREISTIIQKRAVKSDAPSVIWWQRFVALPRKDELQILLAKEFGERHGWHLSNRRQFSWRQLAERTNRRSGPGDYLSWNYGSADHLFLYRENGRPYRPAAIAVHLYNWPNCGPYVAEWAAMSHLHWEEVIDFPSWWYPGSTTLILYMPEKPR